MRVNVTVCLHSGTAANPCAIDTLLIISLISMSRSDMMSLHLSRCLPQNIIAPMFALLCILSVAFAASISKRQTTNRSNNYSGATLLSSPDGTAFNYASTQIYVPETKFVSAEGSPGDTQRSTAWVGISGSSPNTDQGIIQTGCTFFNDGYQDLYTQCWYEFYPAPAVTFDGFEPSPDDTVLLEITRTSPTTGHAAITNMNTGQMVEADFDAPDGTASDGQAAEWIVENPQGGNDFADFQVQYFEGCYANTEGGNTYGPNGGTYRTHNEWKDLGDGQGPTRWTVTTLPSESEVQVNWTGPEGS